MLHARWLQVFGQLNLMLLLTLLPRLAISDPHAGSPAVQVAAAESACTEAGGAE
jgi:hypothetical protein